MPSSWQGVCNFVVEIIIFRVVVGGGGGTGEKETGQLSTFWHCVLGKGYDELFCRELL